MKKSIVTVFLSAILIVILVAMSGCIQIQPPDNGGSSDSGSPPSSAESGGAAGDDSDTGGAADNAGGDSGANDTADNAAAAGSQEYYEIGEDNKYTVGTDIPAGEYVLICEQSIVIVAEDSSGDDSSLITTEMFTERGYLTFEDGQYLTFKEEPGDNPRMYPIANAPPVDTSKGELGYGGMYLVGKDLPAGTYKLAFDQYEMASYKIFKDSKATNRATYESDITPDFDYRVEQTITLENGQYIEIEYGKLILN